MSYPPPPPQDPPQDPPKGSPRDSAQPQQPDYQDPWQAQRSDPYRTPGSAGTFEPAKRQSPFAWAGLLLGLFGILFEGFGFGYSLVLAMENPGAQVQADEATLTRIGCAIIIGMAFHFFGLILSLLSFIQTNRKRTLTWISVILNLVILLLLGGLILIGMIAG